MYLKNLLAFNFLIKSVRNLTKEHNTTLTFEFGKHVMDTKWSCI